MDANRRTTSRQKTNADALIFTNSGEEIICTIKDRSETGAQLCVDCAAELPQEFMLEMSGASNRLRARIVWRLAGNLGVEITA